MTLLAVALGGGLGAVARYAVDGAISKHQTGRLPVGTLFVNIAGSFVLGAFVAALSRGLIPSHTTTWVSAGFFGGFTTFSTFVYETQRLVDEGAWRHVLAYVGVMGPASFAAAGAAYWIVSFT
jgi:fluoride exporter